MKWTDTQIAQLKQMCFDGTSNADLAAHFGVPVVEIHAKRSQHGITIPKIRAAQGRPGMTANPSFEAAITQAEQEYLVADILRELARLRDTTARIDALVRKLGGVS